MLQTIVAFLLASSRGKVVAAPPPPPLTNVTTAAPTSQPSAATAPTSQPSATTAPTTQPSATAAPTTQPSATADPTPECTGCGAAADQPYDGFETEVLGLFVRRYESSDGSCSGEGTVYNICNTAYGATQALCGYAGVNCGVALYQIHKTGGAPSYDTCWKDPLPGPTGADFQGHDIMITGCQDTTGANGAPAMYGTMGTPTYAPTEMPTMEPSMPPTTMAPTMPATTPAPTHCPEKHCPMPTPCPTRTPTTHAPTTASSMASHGCPVCNRDALTTREFILISVAGVVVLLITCLVYKFYRMNYSQATKVVFKAVVDEPIFAGQNPGMRYTYMKKQRGHGRTA